jgi:hypothetical protein
LGSLLRRLAGPDACCFAAFEVSGHGEWTSSESSAGVAAVAHSAQASSVGYCS